MSLKKGDTAPHLTLMNDSLEKVDLNFPRNQHVVLLFFPLAYTSVCTTELCTVRDERQEYADLNADVYGISVDSPFTLQKFKEDHKLPYPLLSDFNKEASRAYNAIYDNFVFDMKGVSKRAAFVIDKKGVIQYAEVLEDAGQLPNFEEIKSSLQKLNA